MAQLQQVHWPAFWRTLQVHDARQCDTPEEAYAHLERHVNTAFNGGKIANVITVFPQAQSSQDVPWRMANHQLVRYAGFSQADGSVLGDPDSVEFTEYCLKQGWEPFSNAMDATAMGDGQQRKGLPPKDVFASGALLPNDVDIAHPDFPTPRPWG